MLRILGLDKTYGNGAHALNNVSLDIPKGMFGLLGPNGAGKSSLMRTIATLQTADAGRVELDGIDVSAQPERIRSRLGYLPQDFGVYPRTSALAFLDHLAVLKGITDKAERKAQVEHLLAQTNLWDVRKKSMTTFSGGMKQRIGIAQALLGRPDLVIVDEPTAGLDPVERRRFHNLLADIGEDVVVILSTHIVDDVANLCSRLAIMANGSIVEQGEPGPLTEAMQGRLWRALLDRETATRLREVLPVRSSRRVAGRVELKVEADACPEGFEPAVAELEDVYFSALAQAGVEVDAV